MSLSRKLFLQKNMDKHPWKYSGKFVSVPCQYLKKILSDHFLWLDPIQAIGHTAMGIAFFDTTEAVRLEAKQVEPEFFLNFTYALVQGPMGWKIAHIHASPAQEEHIQLPSTIHGFH